MPDDLFKILGLVMCGLWMLVPWVMFWRSRPRYVRKPPPVMVPRAVVVRALKQGKR